MANASDTLKHNDLWLDTIEAAELLGTTPAALSQQRQRKLGAPYHKFGKNIRYLRSDLMEWAAEHRVTPKHQPAHIEIQRDRAIAAEERANRAEARACEIERRVEEAENRISDAEERAVQAEKRAADAEIRAAKAEARAA
jgi:hypothetical protein